jgi:large subunit ribosomal protein L30
MATKLKVTLVRSGINRPEPHKLTAAKLGLGKLGRTVVLPDNPAVR